MKNIINKNDEKSNGASLIFKNRISKLYQHFNQMIHKSLFYFREIILEIKRRRILKKIKEFEGQNLGELRVESSKKHSLNRIHTKGHIGRIIEVYFELPFKNESKPDFQHLELEVKTSGIKYIESKKLYNAKERLVLTQIDYDDFFQCEHWSENKHLKKIKRILVTLYLFEKSPKQIEDFQIVHSFIWEPSRKESEMIQRDYKIMRNKIMNRQLLSEKDTAFLGSCPKHQGGYNKNNPSLSKKGSIAQSKKFKFFEKRAFCIRQRAFDQIIADSLNRKLRKIGNSVGLYKNDYRNLI